MIVQERVRKEGNAVAARVNELGLAINDFKIVDWNPMFVDILYEKPEDGPAAAALKKKLEGK